MFVFSDKLEVLTSASREACMNPNSKATFILQPCIKAFPADFGRFLISRILPSEAASPESGPKPRLESCRTPHERLLEQAHSFTAMFNCINKIKMKQNNFNFNVRAYLFQSSVIGSYVWLNIRLLWYTMQCKPKNVF